LRLILLIFPLFVNGDFVFCFLNKNKISNPKTGHDYLLAEGQAKNISVLQFLAVLCGTIFLSLYLRKGERFFFLINKKFGRWEERSLPQKIGTGTIRGMGDSLYEAYLYEGWNKEVCFFVWCLFF
jgi:hypothetical protein